MTDAPTLLASARATFERTALLLRDEVDPEILQKIAIPKERIELRLGPQMESGKVRLFKAFVVRHSDALGPAKGGIRMMPSVTLDDVAGLAMEMTWKCALIGVPFGGGKSGIVADARSLSRFDKETLIRSFARSAHRHIGPLLYVPAPDMGTAEADMGHLKDTISLGEGLATTHGCYVTGKPVICGGIPGRREATGRGVVATLLEAAARLGLEPKRMTAVVQGFGNVGAVVAMTLLAHGLRVIGISDVGGALYRPAGIDVEALARHVRTAGTVAGYAGADAIEPEKLLEVPCDVLVPAAASGQITGNNAPRIQASLIVEGANLPTTAEADEILNARGVSIVPDILANAGGVFVSYLEYAQETQQEQMSESEVNARLQQRMRDRFAEVAAVAQERQCTLRSAAMYLAVRRVCDAVVARGRLA